MIINKAILNTHWKTTLLNIYFPSQENLSRYNNVTFSPTETMRRCGFFLEVFGLTMPDYLQCDIFPESTDTDVCLGNREVTEGRFRDAMPGKWETINQKLYIAIYHNDLNKWLNFVRNSRSAILISLYSTALKSNWIPKPFKVTLTEYCLE